MKKLLGFCLLLFFFVSCNNHCHDRPWIITNVQNFPLINQSRVTINHYWGNVPTKYMKYEVGDTLK